MKFEEIFNNPGLYKAAEFGKGICLKVYDSGNCLMLNYKNIDDINPLELNVPLNKYLFQKDYYEVFTRQELFKPIEFDCKKVSDSIDAFTRSDAFQKIANA